MQPNRHRAALSPEALLAVGSLVVAAVLVLLLWNPWQKNDSGPRELVLYCAAGLIKPVEAIREEYEQQYGVRIQIEPDASGKLLSKMRIVEDHGDLFLAADSYYTDQARALGLVAEVIPVARQRPVIATSPGNPKKIAAVRDLLRDDVKVALANPELAAIGKVARKALERTGEWAELEKQTRQFQAKVSLTGTVNEAAQAVKLGAVDAAILWDATARQYGLELIEVPVFRGSAEHIALGVLSRTPHPQRALHFARYLTARDKGLVHFREHHYEPMPDADAWADPPAVDLMAGAMLRPAVEQVVTDFQEREGVRINWVFNGCGILTSQMKAGARPAAYFACDVKFMDQVRSLFAEPVVVSENDVILLVKKGNPQGIKTLTDLVRPGLMVGLAHPEKAALGELTKRLLDREGLSDRLRASGNWRVESATGDYLVNQMLVGPLDAVLVYRSNALAHPGTVDRLDVIELGLPGAVATQPFAIARDTDHPYLMRRLLDALRSPTSRRRFEALGFRWAVPEGS